MPASRRSSPSSIARGGAQEKEAAQTSLNALNMDLVDKSTEEQQMADHAAAVGAEAARSPPLLAAAAAN